MSSLQLVPLKIFASFLILLCSCKVQTPNLDDVKSVDQVEWSGTIPDKVEPIHKSDQEWQTELSDQEYYVLRKKGTERSFTGDLLNEKRKGLFVCRGCGLPLFSSGTKYNSGTGWPSYYQPLKKEFIKEDTDYILGYARTEVLCARCDGHLGHVFKDGPKPTGLRYCINSVSLDFVPKESD